MPILKRFDIFWNKMAEITSFTFLLESMSRGWAGVGWAPQKPLELEEKHDAMSSAALCWCTHVKGIPEHPCLIRIKSVEFQVFKIKSSDGFLTPETKKR